MKTSSTLLTVIALLISGCAQKPVAVEIGEACAMKRGSKVILRGSISMPDEIEITKFARGGDNVGMTYKFLLVGEQAAVRKSVPVGLWATDSGESNKVRVLPASSYSRSDLTAFFNDGSEIRYGGMIVVVGEVADHEKDGCVVNVERIDRP